MIISCSHSSYPVRWFGPIRLSFSHSRAWMRKSEHCNASASRHLLASNSIAWPATSPHHSSVSVMFERQTSSQHCLFSFCCSGWRDRERTECIQITPAAQSGRWLALTRGTAACRVSDRPHLSRHTQVAGHSRGIHKQHSCLTTTPGSSPA